MLEFKNACVSALGETSRPLSMVVAPGEVVCLCGEPAQTTSLLLAVMGLEPLASGYITVDGEPVVPGSATYFRQQMAYVPRHVPGDRLTVAQICKAVAGLKAHAGMERSRAAWTAQWADLGLEPSLLDCRADDLSTEQLQLVLLSLVPLMHRPIVLLDQPPQHEAAARIVKRLVDDGSEVVFTAMSAEMACDKIGFVGEIVEVNNQ